ncbi:hypothetical protein BGZ61DRAFT_486081 [Ilyonectria robusta]|uniref:uncharacterized protein n=1 Tax=Ilyonectria robusta TaxID=1079257 RepID=UPI001E8D1488|nr:uncharacterized protein BGZ61DRAFT_486081 [Ilyonectria robusta]KAH8658897.1 hypothetical protein BGZ61DRAFT_486081 [Ilyonectria robusta]
MALPICRKWLPPDDDAGAHVCRECHAGLEAAKLPTAYSVNNMDIGCEHRYPEVLDDLSPVEERLIALQAPFGYITKFTVDKKTPSGLSYRKHVKGHIVVSPNKVEDLVDTVLPHHLLETFEDITSTSLGAARANLTLRTLGTFFKVRKSRIRMQAEYKRWLSTFSKLLHIGSQLQVSPAYPSQEGSNKSTEFAEQSRDTNSYIISYCKPQ